jgi:sulfide:quinone oxidoreductase
VTLFERASAVEYLPGAIPVSLGRTTRERWRARLSVPEVEVVAGEVEEISGGGVRLEGRTYEADAVVAAPGLVLDLRRVPDAPGVHAFWDLAGAEVASNAVRTVECGTVAVVVSSLPYRCPPAPFAMAMELASYYGDEGRPVRVVLTTPEEVPLAAVGGGVPEFLTRSCAEADVELLPAFEPDLDSLGDGRLRSAGGVEVEYGLALVVPPHARSALLAGLAGEGPLVPVSPRFESSEPGLFVVGDAAMVPLPRAADAAVAEGRTAADAILERLGLTGEQEPHLPEPECYVGHGGGRYSRISLRYPDGLPPTGSAEVTVEGPSERFATGFEASFDRWRELRGE